ncbi:MAG: zf-HC2 domain-containing protein [Prevotellaceae bacterium]|nr:zf-HC2 domain-containing protein [Prevotellaceae bacterium]
MSKCIHSRGKLIQCYLLNQLGDEQEKIFQEHLLSCKDCRAQVDAVRKLAQTLQSEEQTQTAHSVVWKTILAAAAVLLLLCSGALLFLKHNLPDSVPPPNMTADTPIDTADRIKTPTPVLPVKPTVPASADNTPVKKKSPGTKNKPSRDTLETKSNDNSRTDVLTPIMAVPRPHYASSDSVDTE